MLYTASTEVNIGADATLVVQPLPSGERTIVQRGGYFGRYVASGHIVYMQDDTLFAMPFDLQRLTVTGPAGRAIDGVRSDAGRGSAQFALSQTGTLAYLPGRNTVRRTADCVDGPHRDARRASRRTGRVEQRRVLSRRTAHRHGHSSRRAQRHLGVRLGARHADARDVRERPNEEFPVWTPDGARIVYRSFRSSTDPSGNTISWKRADGTGDAQVLVHSNSRAHARIVASQQEAARVCRDDAWN